MSSPAQPPLVEPRPVEPIETPRPTNPPPVEPIETARPTNPPPVEPIETPRPTKPPLVEPVEIAAPTRRPHAGDRLSRHPEWLTLLLAAAAWTWLAVALNWFHSAGGPVLLPGHHHGPAGTSEAPHSIDDNLLIWVVMVVAMMLPTTVPHVRYLAFNTRASRRQRSIGLFLLGYLAVWLAPGLALALVHSPVPAALVAAAVLAAGVWELTPAKRRALRRCCRTWPVGYAGPRADAAAVEYGLRHGVICLLVSGPAMAALMLAGHPWWATVALTAVMAAQKLLSRPERWRAMVAIGWLASGVAAAGAAMLTQA